MLKLEKRPQPSKVFAWLTPLIAVVLTMLAAHSFDPRLIWDHMPPESST